MEFKKEKIRQAAKAKADKLFPPIIELLIDSVIFAEETRVLKEENAKLRAELETLKNRPSFSALQKIRSAINKKITVAISGNLKEIELLNKQRKARYKLVEDIKFYLQIRSIEHISDQQLEDALKFIEEYNFAAEKAVSA